MNAGNMAKSLSNTYIPEIDCAQAQMSLPPVTSSVFLIAKSF
jgi:hypothetical protein